MTVYTTIFHNKNMMLATVAVSVLLLCTFIGKAESVKCYECYSSSESADSGICNTLTHLYPLACNGYCYIKTWYDVDRYYTQRGCVQDTDLDQCGEDSVPDEDFCDAEEADCTVTCCTEGACNGGSTIGPGSLVMACVMSLVLLVLLGTSVSSS